MNSQFLLIEDDPDHAELIRRALLREGRDLTLHHVLDGQEGLAYLHAADVFPDAILLDLNLPRLSGHEVLLEIKSDKRLCVIPVIVLTTSTNTSDRLRAYYRHANSYLVKPVQLAEFRELLDKVYEYWCDCNIGVHTQ